MKKFILSIFILTSLFSWAQATDTPTAMKTVTGKTLHMTKTAKGLFFDEYKGKILFVEFYGHRCPYCIKAIDDYNDLQEKYKDKLAIVSVEIGGYDQKQLASFNDLYGIEYDNLIQKEADELVPYVSHLGGFRGMVPFLAIFDKDGNFYKSASGVVTKEAFEKTITELSK